MAAGSGRAPGSPRRGRGAAAQAAAVEGRALADADEPAARAGAPSTGRRRGLAVVEDLQDELRRAGRRRVTSAVVRPGVLERVGQGLLHDAVGGQVEPGGQVRRGRRRPGRSRSGRWPRTWAEQRAETGRAPAAAPIRSGSLACGPDGRPAPGGARPGPACPPSLDRAERLPGPVRAGVEHVARRGGLHDDHAEGVGDDVVELAADPGLLFGDRAGGLELLLAAACARPGRAAPRGRRRSSQPTARKPSKTRLNTAAQADLLKAARTAAVTQAARPGRHRPGQPPAATPGHAVRSPLAVGGDRVQGHQQDG